jgi:hypothetical protein
MNSRFKKEVIIMAGANTGSGGKGKDISPKPATTSSHVVKNDSNK